ncbi:hypothetical protein B296_00002410 [Ensete ventricosum]|uniref:Uncharacterized protein n=1 Tax=Ensete ventricosum TaxID=4639 RepID=A0A427B8I2_ENSVE|nr:hypothetical protein B296_00002410 [Ensete ventricosum]
MPTRNFGLLPSVGQFFGRTFAGDPGRPPCPFCKSPPRDLVCRYLLSFTSGGEAGSANCSAVGALTGTEEVGTGRPPPTFGKSCITLMLTISARPTMSHDDQVTKHKLKVSKRTPRSYIEACLDQSLLGDNRVEVVERLHRLQGMKGLSVHSGTMCEDELGGPKSSPKEPLGQHCSARGGEGSEEKLDTEKEGEEVMPTCETKEDWEGSRLNDRDVGSEDLKG